MQEVKIGSFVGTGAAIDLPIGFTPDHVRIVNATDGNNSADWFRGAMADGESTDGTALNAADGISAYEGDDGYGFTAGTDFSTAGKTFAYVASRN